MKEFLSRYRKQIKFLLVGAWNTLFGYSVFALLCVAAARLGVHYLAALVVSNVLAVTNGYFSYKGAVFNGGERSWPEYFRFSSVYIALLAANMVLLPLLVNATRLNPVAAQGILLPFTVVSSYVAHNYFSFNPGWNVGSPRSGLEEGA